MNLLCGLGFLILALAFAASDNKKARREFWPAVGNTLYPYGAGMSVLNILASMTLVHQKVIPDQNMWDSFWWGLMVYIPLAILVPLFKQKKERAKA